MPSASITHDAVVNAANAAGLGCFAPAPRCIDHVLHRMAGPRLRASCRAALAHRAHKIAVGIGVVPAHHALRAARRQRRG